jgi:hypothetical protein
MASKRGSMRVRFIKIPPVLGFCSFFLPRRDGVTLFYHKMYAIAIQMFLRLEFPFIVRSAKPTMQNVECKMQNEE